VAAIDEVPVQRSALDEPTQRVGRRWVTYWTSALFGMYAAYYAGAQILLPEQATAIGGEDGAVALVGLVTAVSAIVTLVVVFLAGVYSDRTLNRRGRRQIWVLAGAVVTGVFVAGQGLATSVPAFVLVWALANVGISLMTAALFAAVPDEVPITQRASVSAHFGNAVAAGPLVGIALVSLVVTDVVGGYLALGILALLLGLPFALAVRGVPLRSEERPALSLRKVVVGIFTPLKHADFAWAWSGRFFIQASNAFAQVFLYLYLQDFVGYEDPATGTLLLAVVYTLGVLIAATPCGRLSDRTLKRKRMVVIASALQGAAGLILAFLHSFPAALVASAVLGLGYGAYAAVDQALITQVLPRPADRGKDLAIINIANVLPYPIVGVVGAIVITSFGYPTLMVLVLVTAVIAALTVQPIKSVR
jgi:MFS family permease